MCLNRVFRGNNVFISGVFILHILDAFHLAHTGQTTYNRNPCGGGAQQFLQFPSPTREGNTWVTNPKLPQRSATQSAIWVLTEWQRLAAAGDFQNGGRGGGSLQAWVWEQCWEPNDPRSCEGEYMNWALGAGLGILGKLWLGFESKVGNTVNVKW